MLKKHQKIILTSVLCTLLIMVTGLFAHTNSSDANKKTQPTQLAAITPANVSPANITPATITPPVITPPVITPQTISPAVISPSVTTPTTTTPTTTTPVTITPARINPGSSAAESTSMSIPNSTASDNDSEISQDKIPVGMVIKVYGTVDSLKEQKIIHPLKQKSLIFAQEMVITKPDSNVALRFNDGTFVVLGPDSILEIKVYRFTIPPKGAVYTNVPKDRAELKLLQGNLKVKVGDIATVNKPSAFAILTPRGRIELTDPKKPELEVIYNNKVGLVVKGVGGLSNSKGQVSFNEKSYGLVSAVVGSTPTTTSTVPMALSENMVINTAAIFSSQLAKILTTYNEAILIEEKNAVQANISDTSADRAINDSEAATLSADEEGSDDGHVEADESDDDDDDDNDSGKTESKKQ